MPTKTKPTTKTTTSQGAVKTVFSTPYDSLIKGIPPEPKNPRVEFLKELGRTALSGMISYLLIEGVLEGILEFFFGQRLNAAQIGALTVALLPIIRASDRGVHVNGQNTGDRGYLGTKGLFGF